jgi:hypothetical protein
MYMPIKVAYVCICICVCICIYVYVCMYVCMCVCACVDISNCILVHACESCVLFLYGYIQRKVTDLFLIPEFNYAHIKKSNSAIKLLNVCATFSYTSAF